ncbi:MAG: dolichyl-phosphate beta-glucosyltransferase [Thermodesulfobacteriota bacterium]
MCYLSIVIPAYNEEKRLPDTLIKIRDYLNRQDYTWEIIVVDDGSADNTIGAAREALGEEGLTVIGNRTNSGKGWSVRRGMLAAKGEVVLFSDADLSTPIEELDKMLPLIREGCDIVIGSRALPDSDIVVPQPRHRQTMGKIFNLLVRGILLGGFRDTQCGFKCYRGEAARAVFGLQRLAGFAFDVEDLYIAGKLGLKVKELPIRWLDSPDSRVGLVGGSSSMLLDLFRIRLYDLAGMYKV